ncbi:hypothetical protein GIW21_07860, partial [Pseudomonas syringae]|nr:hypothetical protein [Pseudomonas syringae]
RYDEALIKAIASRCTEVDSGARNIDNILSKTLMPELAQQADLFTVRRAGVEHRLIGVVTQQAFQVLVL